MHTKCGNRHMTGFVLSGYHMIGKRALTQLRAKHDCQSSLKPAQEHLIGSLTRNLTVFDFLPHTEKITVCDKNSWSARLCFVTGTPFYEPITEFFC